MNRGKGKKMLEGFKSGSLGLLKLIFYNIIYMYMRAFNSSHETLSQSHINISNVFILYLQNSK